MAPDRTVDVAEVIETRPWSRFAVGLIAVSWLVTVLDSFDMGAVSFAVDPMKAAFHVGDKSFGWVGTVSLAGIVVGGFLFGWIGDRLGRRPAVILSTAAFGLLTMAVALASSFPQLLALRFIDGVALGGAIPVLWALNLEYSPAHRRATTVTLMMLGYGAGAVFTGPLVRLIMPHFGWRAVFLAGGLASAGFAVVLLALLPESARFLLSRGRSPEKVRALLRRLNPGHPIPEDARLVLSDEHRGAGRPFTPARLFEGELKWVTVLVWLGYLASSLSTWFLSFWGPQILKTMGLSPDQAAWLTAANGAMAMTGALVLMRFVDRRGPFAVAVTPAIAVPLLLIAGLAPIGVGWVLGVLFVLSPFLGGAHYAIQTVIGAYYPSGIRASASGWASSFAKGVSMFGPALGGIVITSVSPIHRAYAVLAVCPLALAVCAVLLGVVVGRMPRKAADAEPEAPPLAQPAE